MLKAFLANVATFNSACIDMAFSLPTSSLSEYAVPSIGHPTPDGPVPTEIMSDYMVMNPVIPNSVVNKKEESKNKEEESENKEEESENEEGENDVLYRACMDLETKIHKPLVITQHAHVQSRVTHFGIVCLIAC